MAAHNLTAIAYQQLLLFITPSLRYRIRFAAGDTPSLPAMKPEEFQSLFAARLDIFDPIPGQSTDADLTRLHKDFKMWRRASITDGPRNGRG